MTKEEALTLALEALEGADMIDCDMRDAINAIKEVLAQPERPWVELTDAEIQDCYNAAYRVVQGRRLEVTFARAIGVKLKEKNT